MKSEYLTYVEILRAFVKGEKLNSSDIDMNGVLEVANINNTLGIVIDMLLKNESVDLDAALKRQLRSECMTQIMIYSVRAARMDELVARMNEAGIDHLLFKGYVVRNYYPVPEHRTFGDIDFLIRLSDREKMDQLMMELGFERETDWEPVYSYLGEKEYYEIHSQVLETEISETMDLKEYFSHIWDENSPFLRKISGNTYEMKPEYHFIYLLTHIAKHINSSGAGIRMYMDIALFIMHFQGNKEYAIDWDWIYEEMNRLGMGTFLNTTLNAVEQWFGVVSPMHIERMDTDRIDEFLEFTLEGGTFGKVGRDKGLIYAKNNEEGSKGSTLWKRIFPSADEIKSRYTYLEKHPWLLPIAWIHRLFITRNKLEYHLKQAGQIMNADDNEIKRLQRIHKEIGL